MDEPPLLLFSFAVFFSCSVMPQECSSSDILKRSIVQLLSHTLDQRCSLPASLKCRPVQKEFSPFTKKEQNQGASASVSYSMTEHKAAKKLFALQKKARERDILLVLLQGKLRAVSAD